MRKKKTEASSSPPPARVVRGADGRRPIMAVLDLIGRRWTLRVLWELRSGPRGFRELRALCDGMSPNTLSTRLKELKDAGLVENTPDGDLALTEMSRSAEPLMLALLDWANEWVAQRDKRGPT